MSEKQVTLEDHGDYGCIILRRGVLDGEALAQLHTILRETVGRYRVMLLTGSGATFCEGFDTAVGAAEYSRQGHVQTETVELIRRHPAVFIAAVNGSALSDGVSLINVCDLALAADDARIGLPDITRAAYPTIAGPSTQLRILRKHASWMILTGKPVDARTAARWGLINAAVPGSDLMNQARAAAEGIAKLNPVTLDWSKKAVDDIPGQISDWTAALEYGRAVTTVIQNQIGKENFMPKKF